MSSREIGHTGGLKEFNITKEDRDRWENEDTESSKKFKEALGKWRESTGYKVKKLIRSIKPNERYNYKPFLKNTFIATVLFILTVIIYTNLEELNRIELIFIRLGSIFLIVSAFFLLKYIFKLYKDLRYFVQIQGNTIKFSLAILLLAVLFLAYQNRDGMFDPVIEIYDETDFGIFSPFTFTLEEVYEGISVELNVEDLDESEATSIQKIVTDIHQKKDEAKKAFEYVNTLRKENDRDEIKWDERMYELAIFRTKDMHERKYFDHVTPDGKCVKDFKYQFGLDDYTIAENSGAQARNSDPKNMQYTSTVDIMEQVDGWMSSRGHRYNLLYPDHVIGAIGCYYGACVFLGGHTESYGLGAGPCTTGEQGLAYWKTVEKQPGET